MICHNHLKTAIDDYCLNGDKEILLRIANELRYSSLYIPSKRHDGKPVFDIYEGEGDLKLIPLFTDLDEADYFYGSGDVKLLSNSFELYRNVLKTSDIDGYILNPASQNYLFLKDFILAITDIPKTHYYSSNPYSPEELKNLTDSQNQGLEDFISNPQNIVNYEALFDRLSKSTVMTLMLSDIDLSGLFENGILDMQNTGPVASMHIDDVGGRYAAIFSSKDKINSVDTSQFKYGQVVNLSMLVNFVLSEDMDGIILNPSSDDVLIPRQKLLSYSLGFEKYADDERLVNSMYYLLEI